MIDVATKTSYHPRNKYFYFFTQIVVADKFYFFQLILQLAPWCRAAAGLLWLQASIITTEDRRQIEVQRQLAVQEIMMNRRGRVDRQTPGYIWGWK